MSDTLENKDDPWERQRAEAREYTGVAFDTRIRKFVAAITVNGKREHLGSFDNAEDAGAAYENVRSQNPVVRKRGDDGAALSFAALYREFLLDVASIHNVKFGRVEPGDVFMAPGEPQQAFCMDKVDYRKKKDGGRWIFYTWESDCRVCGTTFQTKTLAGKIVTGMTRNCPKHKGAPAPAFVKIDEEAFLREWGERRAAQSAKKPEDLV
jgi:hypothetical protein